MQSLHIYCFINNYHLLTLVLFQDGKERRGEDS
jgi:hypothetical protein